MINKKDYYGKKNPIFYVNPDITSININIRGIRTDWYLEKRNIFNNFLGTFFDKFGTNPLLTKLIVSNYKLYINHIITTFQGARTGSAYALQAPMLNDIQMDNFEPLLKLAKLIIEIIEYLRPDIINFQETNNIKNKFNDFLEKFNQQKQNDEKARLKKIEREKLIKNLKEIEKQEQNYETSLKEIKEQIQKQIENKEKLEITLKSITEQKNNISNKLEELNNN